MLEQMLGTPPIASQRARHHLASPRHFLIVVATGGRLAPGRNTETLGL
jgi:hypothetical protein